MSSPSAPTSHPASPWALEYMRKLNHRRDITPIDEPLITWSGRRGRSPRQYLTPLSTPPFGLPVAAWQARFFGQKEQPDSPPPQHCTEPEIPPPRPDAPPTIVLLFYPRPDQDAARPLHRSESYLRRIERIVALGEQTTLYVPPGLAGQVRTMHEDDPHWYVVDAYATVWDMPNNRHQWANFTERQPALFGAFDGHAAADGELQPVGRYNRPHHSAVCNAKAFVTYDAMMRNPFGSDRWMYVDAGFLFDDGPVDARGRVWGDLIGAGGGLDARKFDRAVGVAGDTGVVMGEYPHQDGYTRIEDDCWTEPRKQWRSRQFIAQVYVGNSLGMLNYSVRFMQTVEDMDANGFYTGREELVLGFVALRYPNTVFSVPWFPLPAALDYRWQFPMKVVFSGIGGGPAGAAYRRSVNLLGHSQ